MRATATDWPASDVAIVLSSIAGLAVIIALLAYERAPAVATPVTIGTLVQRSGSVRQRPAASLVWDEARRGARLGDGASLFVGPGGAAAVALDGGGRLVVDENSLVVLEARRAADEPATVTLRRGGLSAQATRPVRIVGAGGEATLRAGAEARVSGGAAGALDVALLSGDASVSGAAARLATYPVRLSEPAHGARVWFSGAPAPVALRWDGAAARADTVEVARDPGFAARVATFPGERGGAGFVPPAAGTFYWRVVAAGGAPRSEARSVVVAEDVPPLLYAPADGELVVAPPGRALPFWWTEVDGVGAYLVELSASPAFDAVALSVPAARPGAWIDARLPEGTYHWRVRAADPERGRSPPSRASSFRLVHGAVPDAPELLDARIQVEHADR